MRIGSFTKFLSLRFEQQVAALIGLLSLALVGTLLIGTIWIGKRQSADLISKNMTQLAGDMASSLDSSMFERFRELRIISELQPLQAAWRSDPDQVRTILHSLKSSMPVYSWIGFATVDGTVRVATGRLLEKESVAERPWFKQGLAAPSVSDVHDAVRLSKYMGTPRGPEPFRFVDISMPVYDLEHKLIGVLGAHMSWTWADDTRAHLLSSMGADENTQVWILSSAGKVLLGPNFGSQPYGDARLKTFVAERRGIFEDRRDAEPIFTGFAATVGHEDYPGLGWIVIARQPVSIAFQPVNNIIRTTLILGLVVAVLGVILSWMIARRAAKPLQDLTMAAHLIGRDPSTSMLPRLTGCREFIELSASLRSLLRRIGSTERLLHDAEEQAEFDASRFRAEIESLKHQADTDPLTGLINRRAFMDLAEDAMRRFIRYNHSITVFFVDIDFFKGVNDKYGHAAGDAVILKISESLTNGFRSTDKIARFGGEEFVLLLHEIDGEDALALANQICSDVRSATITFGIETIKVTVSIGVAMADRSDKDIEALLERADRALYEAKDRGRDRVVFDEVGQRTSVAA